jgi:hypothetical protein
MRDGLDLDRSTLSDWVGQAVWLLQPIVEGIRRQVFAAEKIHGDDTPVTLRMEKLESVLPPRRPPRGEVLLV